MRTKIGEINSMMDLFERTEKVRRFNHSNSGLPAFEQVEREWRCKLCGAIIIDRSEGMCSIVIYSDFDRHIDLHIKINQLDIDLKGNVFDPPACKKHKMFPCSKCYPKSKNYLNK